MHPILALALSIILGVVAQINLKAGAAQEVGPLPIPINSYILVGMTLYFVAFVLYIYSLRTLPVSVAFPSVSISYVMVALLAHLFWSEPFGLQQIVALLLISSGIWILYQY